MSELTRRLRRAAATGELTHAEGTALSRLERAAPCTAGELARAEHVSAQSMGALLATLAVRGLVERHRDPHDGRRVVLTLSRAGRRVVAAKRGTRGDEVARVLAGFTPAQRRTLRAAAPLLGRIAEQLR